MTAGDVQWMTAGSGILHQEMPKGDPQRPHARLSAVGQPAGVAEDDRSALSGYSCSSAIPEVTDDDGTRVRVICGEFWGKKGPVEGVAADPNYLDVSVRARPAQAAQDRNRRAMLSPMCSRAPAHSAMLRNRARCSPKRCVDPNAAPVYDVSNHSLVLFDRGDEISGSGRRRGNSIPAGLGQADRGAGGLVRPDRDEHAGADAPSDGRTAHRRVHQTSLSRREMLRANQRAGCVAR